MVAIDQQKLLASVHTCPSTMHPKKNEFARHCVCWCAEREDGFGYGYGVSLLFRVKKLFQCMGVFLSLLAAWLYRSAGDSCCSN